MVKTYLIYSLFAGLPAHVAGANVKLSQPDCSRDPLGSTSVCDTSLSPDQRVAKFISRFTLQQKVDNLFYRAPGVSNLGLPAHRWGCEALHGVAGGEVFFEGRNANFSSATSFPMPILTGAAFDDDLVHRVASVIGKEGRAFANSGHSGFDFWAPNINPFRDPRWGRGMETPGEDAFRVQNYAYSLITGLQGGVNPKEMQALAACKHYGVYDVEGGRFGNNINPTPQDLSDYYMPPFKTCARDARASGVMCSYSSVNGVPSCASQYLLQTLLREHWGWSEPHQWVVSDCGAIENVATSHGYVKGGANAAGVSLNAGTDLMCDDFYTYLKSAVDDGVTTERTIDKSLARLYHSLLRVGYFNKQSQYARLGWSDVNTAEAQSLAHEAAWKGMTLLKNDGTLPLPKKVANVAVIGPWADATKAMQSIYAGPAPYLVSPLMGMQKEWKNVRFAHGADMYSSNTGGFDEAIKLAKSSDYIIYCGGFDSKVEIEDRDRGDLNWPGVQLDLISRLSALGKPLIVVQFGGGQLDDSTLLSNPKVNAIVWAGYPGQEGGNALRDVLDGTKSIAGRLPVTQYPNDYVKQRNKLDPVLRPHKETPGITYKWFDKPVLPFGYGKHYTSFGFSWKSRPKATYTISNLIKAPSGLALEKAPFATVSIDVTNTGKVMSDYVGMLFLSTQNAGPKPYPLKSLVAYGRLHDINAGQAKALTLTIPLGQLARADENGNMVIYPGDYELRLDLPELQSGVNNFAPLRFRLTGGPATIETVPRPPSNPVALSYQGCYQDNIQSRLLSHKLPDLRTNTPQECANRCYEASYAFAGVEYGRQCFCGDFTTGHVAVEESRCNSKCPGNNEEFCGGVKFINVYKITPSTTIQPPS